MSLKFRTSPYMTSFSIGGTEYPVVDGVLELPEAPDGPDLGHAIEAHELLPFTEDEGAPARPDDAEREALFNQAVDMGLKPHYKAGVAKLKAMIEEAEEKAPADAQDAPAGA